MSKAADKRNASLEESEGMMAKKGHNSGISAKVLKGIISEIEKAEEEKQTYVDHIKDIYAEAKAKGYNPKIIQRIIADRKKDREELREEQELYDMYLLSIDPDLADVLS